MRLCCLFAVACTSTSPVAITSIASAPRPMAIPARLPATLRVMSYNVNFGIAGDPAAAAAIASAAPEVVFLQETNDAWADALIAALPAYPHHRFTPPHGWPAGGMGVLSKYPIVSIDELPSVNGPFFAWRAIVDTPIGRIQILNVHLRPPMSDGGSWVVGYFSTRENREHELAWHVARLDPKLPTLVVGDFNEEADGRAVAVLDRLGFTDAIAQHAGHHRTWQWPVSRFTIRFQLDHVMYDPQFTAPAAGIVEGGHSDHFPVWADVERVAP